jgi:MinD-like ATPase involved in chromosome partitioning or flagellar assembly
LPTHDPHEDDRRGLRRPPWLSAEDAHRGLGCWPPEREGGSDGYGRGPWVGNRAIDDDDPPPADQHTDGSALGSADSRRQPGDTPANPPHAQTMAREAAEPQDLWPQDSGPDAGRRRVDRLETDRTALQARRPADIAAAPDANVEPPSAANATEHRWHDLEPGHGNGHFPGQGPPRVDFDSDEVGTVYAARGTEPDEDIRKNTHVESTDAAVDELDLGAFDLLLQPLRRGVVSGSGDQSGSAGDEVDQTGPVSGASDSDDAVTQPISVPPPEIPVSAASSEFDHTTSDTSEPDTEQRVVTPPPEAIGELPVGPQGFGFPPPGAPLPPPGWPPGAVMPPAWWLPPGPPTWPPAPPGVPPPTAVPPPPNWQPHWGSDAESPLARSHTPMPRDARQAQTSWTAASLDEASVVNPRKDAPRSGWRRAVHRATRGHVNPGDARKDREKEHLLAQIRQPIGGDFRVAVLSIKGGVGKTTTTLGLGSALAIVRRDRVIAVDANPDRGTLGERVCGNASNSTVRDLLTDPNINRYADVRGHTRMAVSRLEVLANEQDPAAADVFDEADYRRTIDILGRYYNIILTDCGTGIMHSAMAGVLDLAHSVVLVSSPAMDAVRSASATLDWLMRHGHSDLVREGHVVLSAARPGAAALKLDKVYEFFEARCRSIHFIPFDPHLAEGADVDFAMLKPATYQAYVALAGAVAENFPQLRAGQERP